MFTGIIEELGTVKSLDQSAAIAKLQVFAPKIAEDIQLGQSVSVNGVCLTIVRAAQGLLCFELMPPTIQCTNFSLLKSGDKINLERALRADGRISGHLVTGHIDATGIITRKVRTGGDVVIEIKTSEQLLRYMVRKGSVALDGVSLTVSMLEKTIFGVNLIPYTLENTTLGFKKEQDLLNIECDILAKYMERLLSPQRYSSDSKVSLSFLQEHGFTP